MTMRSNPWRITSVLITILILSRLPSSLGKPTRNHGNYLPMQKGSATRDIEPPLSNAVKLANMTLYDVQMDIKRASENLHSTLQDILAVQDKLSYLQHSTDILEEFQEELESLWLLISSSNVSTFFWGVLTISHGPYCNGIMKSGTIWQIFSEMLEEAINATVTLVRATNIDSVLANGKEVSCRQEALSTIVRLLPGRLQEEEISVISEALHESRLRVEEEGLPSKERLQEEEEELKYLREKKLNVETQLRELREMFKNMRKNE
ncbi:hypothetical protein SK128_026994, partial [Halocaridina rubra]